MDLGEHFIFCWNSVCSRADPTNMRLLNPLVLLDRIVWSSVPSFCARNQPPRASENGVAQATTLRAACMLMWIVPPSPYMDYNG